MKAASDTKQFVKSVLTVSGNKINSLVYLPQVYKRIDEEYHQYSEGTGNYKDLNTAQTEIKYNAELKRIASDVFTGYKSHVEIPSVKKEIVRVKTEGPLHEKWRREEDNTFITVTIPKAIGDLVKNNQFLRNAIIELDDEITTLSRTLNPLYPDFENDVKVTNIQTLSATALRNISALNTAIGLIKMPRISNTDIKLPAITDPPPYDPTLDYGQVALVRAQPIAATVTAFARPRVQPPNAIVLPAATAITPVVLPP